MIEPTDNLENNEQIAELTKGIQKGIEYISQTDFTEIQPKQMRLELNIMMIQHNALVEVLVDKRLITKEEYTQYVIRHMEQEIQAYKEDLHVIYGENADITLDESKGDEPTTPKGEAPSPSTSTIEP